MIKKGRHNPNKGKKHTEETKRKISIAVKGKNNGFYGKKHSEETKNKMKRAWIARRLKGDANLD